MSNRRPRPNFNPHAVLLFWVLAGPAALRSQSTLTWAPGGATVPGGTGTWNTTSSYWTSTGKTTTKWPAGTSSSNDIAIFGGTGGTVTVSGAIKDGGMVFNSNGYVINVSGSNSLKLVDETSGFPSIINVANAGQTATINGTISGTVGLNFVGPGNLTLSGTSTFTGGLSGSSGGTLKILTAGGALSASNDVNLGEQEAAGPASGSGISLVFDNTAAAAATSQSLGNLGVYSGDNTVETNRVAAFNLTLTFNSFSRSADASVNLVTNGGVSGTSNTIVLNGQSGFVSQGAFFDGSNYAWADSGSVVRGINYGVDAGSVTSAGATSIASTAYVQTTGDVTAQTSATFTTLNLSGSSTFTIADGNTLTVNGILKSGGTSATISGGTLQAATDQDLILRADQASDTLTISSVIAGTSSSTYGSGTVATSGAGTIVLSGANTFNGALFLNSGAVSVATLPSNSEASPIGEGTLTFAGGALNYTGGSVVTNHTFLGEVGGGTLNVVQAGTTLEIDSGFSGANVPGAGNDLIKTGSGTLILGGTTDNSGLGLTVDGGTVVLAKNTDGSGSAVSQDLTVNSGGTVQFAGSGNEQVYLGTPVTVNAGGVLDLNGQSELLDALSGAGSVTNNSSAAASVLTVGANNSSSTFSGVLSNGSNGESLSLVKSGSGTFTLSGANTFSGTTAISGGVLLLANSQALGQSTLTYTSAGGTLSFGTLTSATLGGLSGSQALALTNASSGAVALTVGANNSNNTYSGVLSGTGSLTVTGTGTFTLSGANTYTGTTTISSGTLQAGTIVVASGKSQLGNATSAVNLGGALTEGTLDYTGNSATYTRGFTVNAGGGEVDVASSGQTLTVATGGIADGGSIAFGGAGNATVTSTISGVGSLRKSGGGTLLLSGTNTFSGGTTLTAGTLQAGSAGAFGSGTVGISAGTLNVAGYAVSNNLTVNGGTVNGLSAYTGTQTVQAPMSYSGTVGGGLVIANGGSVNTTGATFTGATTVQSGGTLSGTGTVGTLNLSSGGILAPGNSPGTITAGNTTLNGGSIYQWQINNATGTAGTNWDLLNVNGTLTLAAGSNDKITVSLQSLTTGNQPGMLSGFTGTQNENYTFITATNITGYAANDFTIDTSGFQNEGDGTWTVTETGGNTLDLSYSAVPEPSAYAALMGGAALLAAAFRRRRWSRPA